MRLILLLIILVVPLSTQIAVAQQKQMGFGIITAQALAQNSKIKRFLYRPNYIYRYDASVKYQSHLRLQPGETIQTISMGNSLGWEITEAANRLFIKPRANNLETNMTLLTNRRVYQIHLVSKEYDSFYDPALTFEYHFVYEDDLAENLRIISSDTKSDDLDFSDPSRYNFNYSFSGPDVISPLKIFDDGEFTYFEFPEKNAEVPAIFYVDSDGYEGLVNYRAEGNYIVVERISELFTLRHGVDTICVYNEKLRQLRATKIRKK